MICPVCGERASELKSFGYQALCEDCFSVFCREEKTVERHLPGFLQSRLAEFLPWMLQSDLIGEDYRLAGMGYTYRLWKKDHPELARDAERDFTRSLPGEWEEYVGLNQNLL